MVRLAVRLVLFFAAAFTGAGFFAAGFLPAFFTWRLPMGWKKYAQVVLFMLGLLYALASSVFMTSKVFFRSRDSTS